MALPSLSKVLAAADASDLIKDLAKPAVVALIAKVTGVNIANPNFDTQASEMLTQRVELRTQLIRDIRAMDLESQKVATEFETVQITSLDKRVRNTRPLVMRVFAALIAVVVLMAPYALWQEISYQKLLFERCFSLDESNACFKQISVRTTFVNSLLVIYGSALITTVAGGMLAYMTTYAWQRSQEKKSDSDDTIIGEIADIVVPESHSRKSGKTRARLPRRRPMGSSNE